MNVALDTNAYTRLLKGQPEVVRTVANCIRIYVPVVVLGELEAGFACGTRRDENLHLLRTFLQSPKVEVLTINAQTATHYAELYCQLRQQGTPIPVNDVWIAALALQYNLWLCSDDQHFDHLPQIPRC